MLKIFLVMITLLSSGFSFADQIVLQTAAISKAKKGHEVTVEFSKPISFKQFKPEYERNFIQFVLHGVGIRNAISLNAKDDFIEKVFIYPYQPGVTRIRVYVKGDAEAAKGLINTWNTKSNAIGILIKASAVAKVPAKESVNEAPLQVTKEEEQLLKNVIKSTENTSLEEKGSAATTGIAATSAVNAANVTTELTTNKGAELKQTEAIGVKSDPSRNFGRMILSLLVVVALFVGSVFLLKKYASKLDLKKLPFSKKERLIQVVATHRLGRNQAISLVKVTNEYMVMSVSGDNISLIAKLGKDVDVEKYLENRYWGGAFEHHLDKLNNNDDAVQAKNTENSALKYAYDGVKDVAAISTKTKNIQSAFRSSIKEKINQLKPLS